jgi:hypothetical protein
MPQNNFIHNWMIIEFLINVGKSFNSQIYQEAMDSFGTHNNFICIKANRTRPCNNIYSSTHMAIVLGSVEHDRITCDIDYMPLVK